MSVVAIFGGRSEIGLEIAARLASGNTVVLASRADGDQLEVPEAQRVLHVDFDADEVARHTEVVAAIEAEAGPIDIAVLTFGVLGDQALAETDPAEVVRILHTDFVAQASLLTVLAIRMRDRGAGTLVAFSSVAGRRVRRANYAYGSAKAGLDGFASGLADALHGSGVDVIIARPGFVIGRMTPGMKPAPFCSIAPEVAEAVVDRINKRWVGRVGIPRHLRALFSGSPRSSPGRYGGGCRDDLLVRLGRGRTSRLGHWPLGPASGWPWEYRTGRGATRRSPSLGSIRPSGGAIEEVALAAGWTGAADPASGQPCRSRRPSVTPGLPGRRPGRPALAAGRPDREDPEQLFRELPFEVLGSRLTPKRLLARFNWLERQDGGLLLVCANAKRDLCCALRGRPIALALERMRPRQVWERTHTGGHRFAPTAIVLPAGQALARLTPEVGLAALDAADEGRLARESFGPWHDRGRGHLPPVESVAEAHVRELSGETDPAALTTRVLVDGTEVRVTHRDGRTWTVRLALQTYPDALPESCAKAAVTARSWTAEVTASHHSLA